MAEFVSPQMDLDQSAIGLLDRKGPGRGRHGKGHLTCQEARDQAQTPDESESRSAHVASNRDWHAKLPIGTMFRKPENMTGQG